MKKDFLKTRLLKKINSRVRILWNGKKYVVEKRYFFNANRRFDDWHMLNKFETFNAAIYQKHHYIRTFLFKEFGVLSKYLKKYGKK